MAKVLVIGEGPHELGHVFDEPLSLDSLPALPRLIHRLLDEQADVSFVCRQFKPVGQSRVADIVRDHAGAKASALARKVVQAVAEARREGFQAVVILIDRDRWSDKERIAALRSGRDSSNYSSCAVGTAVEAFDAWMIVDGKAISAAGGDSSKSHTDPEKLDGKESSGRHPKNRAAEIFGTGSGLGVKYAMIAGHVRLDLLGKCCPDGFAPFAQDVRKRILPILS